MIHKVLITGNHPIKADLTKQFERRGDVVTLVEGKQTLSDYDLTTFSEVVVLADFEGTSTAADNMAMGVIEQLAENYIPEGREGKRLLCHLLLRSQSLLQMIQQNGFREQIKERLEINAFTMDELWSRVVAQSLDREPITIQSEKTVHLVIFGMTAVAEQLAITAAHVCHYPNYLKSEHAKRTRITIVDEAAYEKGIEWSQKYKHLFDNSHYRFVDTKKRHAIVGTSTPMYKDREDFVDIEWEFVTGSPFDKLMRSKMVQWTASQTQLLTIVLTDNSLERQLNMALYLPEEVAAERIPVYVYMQDDEAYRQIQHNSTPNIIPFGMINRGYDINIPLLEMAKNVNYIYDCCYRDNIEKWNGHMHFSVDIDEKDKEDWWRKKSALKQTSNIYNAMTIGVKMRSMGFTTDDWDKVYDLSEEEIEILAEVEHNRWNVEELILGWRPCTDMEQHEVEEDIRLKEILKKRKIHYDLRAYDDLRPDSTGKSVQIYDRCLSACIPLIAKVSKGGDL